MMRIHLGLGRPVTPVDQPSCDQSVNFLRSNFDWFSSDFLDNCFLPVHDSIHEGAKLKHAS